MFKKRQNLCKLAFHEKQLSHMKNTYNKTKDIINFAKYLRAAQTVGF
jgi:hypothetical protein